MSVLGHEIRAIIVRIILATSRLAKRSAEDVGYVPWGCFLDMSLASQLSNELLILLFILRKAPSKLVQQEKDYK